MKWTLTCVLILAFGAAPQSQEPTKKQPERLSQISEDKIELSSATDSIRFYREKIAKENHEIKQALGITYKKVVHISDLIDKYVLLKERNDRKLDSIELIVKEPEVLAELPKIDSVPPTAELRGWLWWLKRKR